ncbi:exopolysaccharide biosynthesis protein [Agrobacterium sp. lyk4-40-TYG-31]|uniref:exopolysaccharide biosynthesis protein n=1 Tax=Agrobacterium sp. lyk4-40-TYG-31 TaxID=3040276 RepID=UPI000DDA5321|nr:exopolysaccharide biosynthesis protein [Agrobacterium sp. lyk4-40-TYG-31]
MKSEANADQRQQDLGGLLRDIEAHAWDSEQLSIHNIRETVGERSFGPFLTIPAIIEMSPIGGIPGLPTVIALVISFFAIQILFGRKHLWLPDCLEKRKISGPKLERGVAKIQPASQWIDKLVRPRMAWATKPPFLQGLAALSIALCATVPPLELIPFASTLPMAAVALIGLSLTARDGLLACLALLLSAGTGYAVFRTLSEL